MVRLRARIIFAASLYSVIYISVSFKYMYIYVFAHGTKRLKSKFQTIKDHNFAQKNKSSVQLCALPIKVLTNSSIPSSLVTVFSAEILAAWLEVGCFDSLVLTTLNRPISPTVYTWDSTGCKRKFR